MNYNLLYQWTNELARELGCLNSWQVESVGLFSYGVIRAGSCQQQSVARQVSCGEQVESAAQRWRRYLSHERFPLEPFFGAWTKWVISQLGQKRVTLLVDETKIADRMAVMMVGVAWEGRCIPLAWRAYGANSASSLSCRGAGWHD